MRDNSLRTLFLCWPPYNGAMAIEAVRAYQGDTVVYIGESYGGCTADDDFFTLMGEGYEPCDKSECSGDNEPDYCHLYHGDLKPEWERVDDVVIPRWYGLHDYLYVYKRI